MSITTIDEADLDRVRARALASLPRQDTRAEAADLTVRTAAELIGQDPAYSKLAARLLAEQITLEAAGAGSASFSASIALGHRLGLIADQTRGLVAANSAHFTAWSRSSPPGTRSSPTIWSSTSTSTSTPRRPGSTSPGSCSRRPSTSSSTSRCSTRTCRSTRSA